MTRYEIRNGTEVWYRPGAPATPWRMASCCSEFSASRVLNALIFTSAVSTAEIAMLAGAGLPLWRICDAMRDAAERAARDIADQMRKDAPE